MESNFSVLAHRVLDVGDVRDIAHVSRFDIHAIGNLFQVAARAAVEVLSGNDVVAGAEEIQHGRD